MMAIPRITGYLAWDSNCTPVGVAPRGQLPVYSQFLSLLVVASPADGCWGLVDLSTESKLRVEEKEIFSCDHKQVDDRKLTAGLDGRGGGRVENGSNRKVSSKQNGDTKTALLF